MYTVEVVFLDGTTLQTGHSNISEVEDCVEAWRELVAKGYLPRIGHDADIEIRMWQSVPYGVEQAPDAVTTWTTDSKGRLVL